MEFAVLKTGGKQYKVAVGDVLAIEAIKGDYKVGDKLTFEEVLLKDNGSKTEVGTPTIPGAKIEASIAEIGRLDKVLVVRYRAKSRYHKKNGHRQPFMSIKIESIK
jgi:large subunit ribosomal protein L21